MGEQQAQYDSCVDLDDASKSYFWSDATGFEDSQCGFENLLALPANTQKYKAALATFTPSKDTCCAADMESVYVACRDSNCLPEQQAQYDSCVDLDDASKSYFWSDATGF